MRNWTLICWLPSRATLQSRLIGGGSQGDLNRFDQHKLDELSGLQLDHLARDERTIAERKWAAPIRASKPQQPCDHGMFGDEKDQLDLCEMFADPTNPP